MMKAQALAQHLGCDVEDVEESKHDDAEFEAESETWLVLTEEEANKRTRDNIRESLWAFRVSFLQYHLKVEGDRVLDALERMQAELCEDTNEILFALVKDFDHLVRDAVLSDGRGHFLSGYDGEEHEVRDFRLFRTN